MRVRERIQVIREWLLHFFHLICVYFYKRDVRCDSSSLDDVIVDSSILFISYFGTSLKVCWYLFFGFFDLHQLKQQQHFALMQLLYL